MAIPFWAFLDPDNNLCLIYPNESNKRHEVFKYNLRGNWLGLILGLEAKKEMSPA